MNNLAVRTVSAILMLAFGISCLAWNGYSRGFVISLVLVSGSWEFARMVARKYGGARPAWLVPLAVAALIAARTFPALAPAGQGAWAWGISAVTVPALALAGFYALPIATMGAWIFLQGAGYAFLGLWGGALFDLTGPGPGLRHAYPLLLVVLCMATADTGAYFTGKALGRHKLSPSISPKKTVEGLMGGTVLTMLLCLALGPAMAGISRPASLGLGILLSLTAPAGDLLLSALKRHVDVKDTSALIPGHGGVLDRFDSLLLSAPVAAVYLRCF